jgi:hypothetical protein
MYSDELSDYLRIKAQPLTKFRQFCDAGDGAEKGLGRGDKFFWDVYSDIGTQGRELDERAPIPESGFSVGQRSLTITEAGNSVPFTGKLMDLAKHDVQVIIDKTLKNDARKYFDIKAYTQFKSTRRSASRRPAATPRPPSRSPPTARPRITNNVALGTGHIKAISDYMKESNIPAFRDDDYMCISHPSTYRAFKNQLEGIKQYTARHHRHLFGRDRPLREHALRRAELHPEGRRQRLHHVRPLRRSRTCGTTASASWALFFGGDTVTEAIALPEEIRAKIPGDYGRSRGIAWYYEGGFGLVHDDTADPRVFKWDSAA